MYIIHIYTNWRIHTYTHVHKRVEIKYLGKFLLLKYTTKGFRFGFIIKIVNLLLYQSIMMYTEFCPVHKIKTKGYPYTQINVYNMDVCISSSPPSGSV